MLAAPDTELCPASSSWTPALGTRSSLLLLLPVFLTHFMAAGLRVTRLNTPLGRYGRVRGGGSVLGGLGFRSAMSPLLGGGRLAVQGQCPSPRGCPETLASQRAAEGKAK